MENGQTMATAVNRPHLIKSWFLNESSSIFNAQNLHYEFSNLTSLQIFGYLQFIVYSLWSNALLQYI
jgi:hypothetical protein